jgi:putative ABC transport system permease protein
MSIDLLDGQDFSQADLEISSRLQEDSTLMRSILINQALAGAWGWSEDEAVGKVVNFNGRRSLIKGVIQNFHFASLHQSIEALVLFPENWGRIILVKLTDGHIQNSIDKIRDTWSGIITHRPFNYHFLDEEFAEMYRFETQNARVTYVFTWLAILLACLGLFGVASYGFAQRTREIGIRKVLGSSAGAIFYLACP